MKNAKRQFFGEVESSWAQLLVREGREVEVNVEVVRR